MYEYDKIRTWHQGGRIRRYIYMHHGCAYEVEQRVKDGEIPVNLQQDDEIKVIFSANGEKDLKSKKPIKKPGPLTSMTDMSNGAFLPAPRSYGSKQ